MGDKVCMSDGTYAIVNSLSGSSIRCKDSKGPILTKIVGLPSN